MEDQNKFDLLWVLLIMLMLFGWNFERPKELPPHVEE